MANKQRPITEKDRDQVEKLAALGLKDEIISSIVDIPKATLQRRCRKELDKGRALAKGTLAKTAYAMATSGKCPTMTIFLCKTMLGMKETTAIEYPDKDGNPQAIAPIGVVFYIPENGRDAT